MASSLLVDIVAYWKLDTNAWLDSTGNGYTLTDNGGVTLAAGIINDGAFANSNSQFLTNTSFAGFGTGDFSVSLWVNYSALDGYPPLLSTRFDDATGTEGWSIGIRPSEEFYFYNAAFFLPQPSTPPNVWNNIVVTREAGVLNLYLNGSYIGSDPNGNDFSMSGIALLGNTGLNAYSIEGTIDEVGTWSRALLSSEVSDLYNGGVGNSYPFSVNPDTQIIYYNNAEADEDWGNLLNWWQDAGFSVQATALPTPTNPVNVYNIVSQNTQGADQCFCDSGNFFSVNFGTGLTLQSSGVVNFYGSSVLSGNTTGGVSMHDSSYIDIPSTIGGNVTLRDASLNTGTINGNATVYYDGGQGTYPIGGTVLGTVTYIGFNFGQTCYFANTVNQFLGTVGNWWLDSAYTIPAGFLPNLDNDVVFNGWVIEGVTGTEFESVTYKSIVSNGATFNGGNYANFTVISTNGIIATNSEFYVCTINANGTYTGCTFVSGDYGKSAIIGNVSLYTCQAIFTNGTDIPIVTTFTGVVNAYFPTNISSGAVTGSIIRHGYTLRNTCIAHCNLNETSGTRTVLDLYEEQGILEVTISGAGISAVNGTYTRVNALTFNGPNGYNLLYYFNDNEWRIILPDSEYYLTTDFLTWGSTNAINDPAPTTDSTTSGTIPVGYGTGLIGNAAKFNNNSLVNPNPVGGNLSELEVQFSISVWVNFPVVPSTPPQAIVGTGYDLYPNSLTINIQNGNLGLFVDATIGGQITGQSITANTWHNCVVTCTTNSIKFYVDGVFQAQFATPLFYTAGVYLSQYLGGYQLTNNALVDEFNLFNLDLNQDQINQLYNGGAGSTFPFITGGGGGGTIDWARMLHLPFFFDSRKPSLARLLYLPWFINI